MNRTYLPDHFLSHQIQLVFLTFSTLNETFDITVLNFLGHFEFVSRRNRCHGIHGGVVVFERMASALQSCDFELASELVFRCGINVHTEEQFLIFPLVYLPPHSKCYAVSPEEPISSIEHTISSFSMHPRYNVEFYLWGIFKLPKIRWSKMCSTFSLKMLSRLS